MTSSLWPAASRGEAHSIAPWGVTIDHQSTQDETVTLRDRDSLQQERVPIAELAGELERRLDADWTTPKSG